MYRLDYPSTWKSITFIGELKTVDIKKLQKNEALYVIDASFEGYSPVSKTRPFFDAIYQDCEKYDINPRNIIYISSNLKDENNLQDWLLNHPEKESINLLCYNRFTNVTVKTMKRMISNDIDEDMENNLHINRQMLLDSYNGKFFTSLSRISKSWRTIGSYIFSTQEYSDRGLFSQNHHSDILDIVRQKKIPVDVENLKEWLNRLPLTLDRNDFTTNWAYQPYGRLLNQCLFHIVNETWQNSENNTSLFYSEKTFKPMTIFQPFVIWGQPGINHYIKEMGFKTYDDWFDLSFDYIEDDFTRLLELSKVVGLACKELENFSTEDQISWRFKNMDVLKHNYQTLMERKWDIKRVHDFMSRLEHKIL